MKCFRCDSTLALTDDFINIVAFLNARKLRNNPTWLIKDTLRAQTIEILYIFYKNETLPKFSENTKKQVFCRQEHLFILNHK